MFEHTRDALENRPVVQQWVMVIGQEALLWSVRCLIRNFYRFTAANCDAMCCLKTSDRKVEELMPNVYFFKLQVE